MYRKFKIIFLTLFCLAAAIFSTIYLIFHDVGVLNPKGIIAVKERNLLVVATLLMLIVVLPVLTFIFTFAWIYRDGYPHGKYEPDWDHSYYLEAVWWGIPILIIGVLSIITWESTHALDPYKSIDPHKKPLTIQVVALQWKWLFIYPEQNIATLNHFHIPIDTPIKFAITADAPMNSFWIPELSGQIFAMPKMRTELNIVANKVGNYRGCSANISGRGFSEMRFITKATTQEDFDRWVEFVKKSPNGLNTDEYNLLAEPSEHIEEVSYVLKENDLFDRIVMKYMMPSVDTNYNQQPNRIDLKQPEKKSL